MAKLSEIKLPDNNTYEFKDSDAQYAIRQLASNTVSNLINITKVGSYVVDDVLISINSDGRVYIEGTATADISFLLSEDFFTTDTQSSCVLFVGDATTDGSSDTWWLELSLVGSSYISYDETPISLPNMIMNGDLYLHIKSGTNLGGVGFYPMIIESALYNIGVRSGSYGPTNHDLYLSLKYAQQTISKMDISAGSDTTPIYFDNGVPTSCTYTIEKSVPSDAVFTDTTYESKSAASGGTALSLCTTGEKYTWNNKADLGDIIALQTNITSSTSITAYVNALSKGHYVTYYASTSKPSDAPADANCFVEIFVYSSTTALVRVTPTSSSYFGTVYEINKLVGTWQTQWVSHGYGTQIPDNTDMNTITTVGDYYIGVGTSAETMTNLPEANSGHVSVCGANSYKNDRLRQIYTPTWNSVDKVCVWERHLINTNQWSAWVKYNNLGNRLGTALVSGDDLNDFKTPGIYQCPNQSTANGVVNTPIRQAYRLEVSALNTTDRYVQTVIAYNTNASIPTVEIYRRLYVSAGWTAWKHFMDVDAALSQLSATNVRNVLPNESYSKTSNAVVFTTNNDGSITIKNTASNDAGCYLIGGGASNTSIVADYTTGGPWILSVSMVDKNGNAVTSDKVLARVYDRSESSSASPYLEVTAGSNAVISGKVTALGLIVKKNYVADDHVVSIMIRHSGFIDSTYTPYAPTNRELYQYVTGIKILDSSVDLNNLLDPVGTWYGFNAVGSGASHLPIANGNFNVRIENIPIGATYIRQICYIANASNVMQTFVRGYSLSTNPPAWTSWSMLNDAGLGMPITSNMDLNTLVTPGAYRCETGTIAATLSNTPISNMGFRLETYYSSSDARIMQEVSPNTIDSNSCDIYRRTGVKNSGTWSFGSWYKWTGVQV